MSSREFDDTSNEAIGFSGFGGHQLAQVAEAGMMFRASDDEETPSLQQIGIEDAEQLVAIAAVPGGREALEEFFGDRDKLYEMLDTATSILPEPRLMEVREPDLADRGLGVLPPSAEMLAVVEEAVFRAEAPEPIALPSSVNLIPHMSAIRHQQSRGTCVSFTLTALNEYVRRRNGQNRDLSEQHLYYEVKLVDGASNACGTWQTKAVQALQSRGQCREAIWPYDPNPPCNNHGPRPASARPSGVHYRLSTQVVSPRSVAAFKAHMAAGRPVTISIPVYNSWYQSAETRRSGRITMRVGSEPSAGGHAMCLVGYQDNAATPGGGYFLVRNSWGQGWAYQSPYGAGYGTIPYQYIANENWEAYTAAAGVLGPDEEEEEEGTDDNVQPDTSSATISIEVAPNVKITIRTGR